MSTHNELGVRGELIALEFLEKKIAKDYNKAQNILHLQESNSTVNAQGEMKDISKIKIPSKLTSFKITPDTE